MSDASGGAADALPAQPRGAARPAAHAAQAHPITLAGLVGAIGVVFGDIGTSPLYGFRESLAVIGATGIDEASVLGVLSMIFWSLTLVVSIKYLLLVMRADNDGEGGTLALLALVLRQLPTEHRWRRPVIIAGLLGAALFYGDSVITPAISVLSAVEGLEVAAPALHAYTVPIALVILVLLFLVQSKGTGRVGVVFGPICLLWFVTIGSLGLLQILQNPGVLRALSPTYAVAFFGRHPYLAFILLGSVFLVVTGAEALYADMGHFGRRTIKLAWFSLVMPALVLNYFGQGALVLSDPTAARNPFFLMAPDWLSLPLVILATAATVIASQAVISGAFTMTTQAINLGYLPRMQIDYTSEKNASQIYVPFVNWMLLIFVVALVVGFGSSERMAGAYGLAVAATLMIEAMVLPFVASARWGWSTPLLVAVFVPMIALDAAFLASNVVGKLFHGAWFPLVFGALTYFMFATWKVGRGRLRRELTGRGLAIGPFIKSLSAYPPQRVEGTAVFMTPNVGVLPHALLHNLKHNKVMHERVIFLSATTQNVPHVPDADAIDIHDLGGNCYAITARIGFQDPHDIAHIARMLSRLHEFEIEVNETSFFLSRETILATASGEMSRWRTRLFSWMMRNAQPASDFFRIPPNRVIEIGTQIAI